MMRISSLWGLSSVALVTALSACAPPPGGAPQAQAPAAAAATQERLAPEIFSEGGVAIWDGLTTLQGVWVAHPLALRAQRVRIFNVDTGEEVDGALFRRDPSVSGPSIIVSSDAALALKLQPGLPAKLRVIALREGPPPAPADSAESPVETEETAPPAAATETAADEPPAAGSGTDSQTEVAAAETTPEPEAGDDSAAEAIPAAEPDIAPEAGTGTATAPAAEPEPPTEAAEAPDAAPEPEPAPEAAEAASPDDAAPEAAAETDDAPAPSDGWTRAEAAQAIAAGQPDQQTADEAPASGELETAVKEKDIGQPPAPAEDPAPGPADATPVLEIPEKGPYSGALPAGLYVQAGTFGVEPNAQGLVDRLRGAGHPAFYQKQGQSGQYNRVVIGPLPDRAAADAVIAAAAKAGAPGATRFTK